MFIYYLFLLQSFRPLYIIYIVIYYYEMMTVKSIYHKPRFV